MYNSRITALFLSVFSDSRYIFRSIHGSREIPSSPCAYSVFLCQLLARVSQGFWGTREHWQNIEGNKGTLANFWEQGTKFRKITVRKHSERVWEHGHIGQFWKGTREQGPPWETLTSRGCRKQLGVVEVLSVNK